MQAEKPTQAYGKHFKHFCVMIKRESTFAEQHNSNGIEACTGTAVTFPANVTFATTGHRITRAEMNQTQSSERAHALESGEPITRVNKFKTSRNARSQRKTWLPNQRMTHEYLLQMTPPWNIFRLSVHKHRAKSAQISEIKRSYMNRT